MGTAVIGPHYGEWWNERPAHALTRLAIVLVSLLLVLAWGVYAGLSGSRLRAALFEATERGDADAVRALLASGGSASAQHADGTALLHWAQEHGHRELAMLLAAITPAVEPFGTPAAAPRASAGCVLPRRMHRASRVFLDHYIEGDLTVAEFRRLFSLPNSDYLGLGACLIALYE